MLWEVYQSNSVHYDTPPLHYLYSSVRTAAMCESPPLARMCLRARACVCVCGGVVWRGVAWHGMAWRGVVWCGAGLLQNSYRFRQLPSYKKPDSGVRERSFKAGSTTDVLVGWGLLWVGRWVGGGCSAHDCLVLPPRRLFPWQHRQGLHAVI